MDTIRLGIKKTLHGRGYVCLWTCARFDGVFLRIDTFVLEQPNVSEQVAIRRRVEALFSCVACIRYHVAHKWLLKDKRGRAITRASLGSWPRMRHNRFFFRMSALLQLGVALRDHDLIASVVCMLIKKHNRHWLVLRFLNNALRAHGFQKHRLAGVLVRISGKINGRPRKKKRFTGFGWVPFQSIGAPVAYRQRVVVTKFGAFGVRVWVTWEPLVKQWC